MSACCISKPVGLICVILLLSVIHRSDCGRRGFSYDVNHVRVRLMCHGRRCVTEKGGDLVHGHLLIEEQRRCGVPSIVEPYLAYARLLAEIGPSVRDVVGTDAFLLDVHEDGAFWCRFWVHGEASSFKALSIKVAAESLKSPRVHGDSAHLACLRAVEYV